MNDTLVGAKLGNYRLEKLLGQGRMGVVYLARDEALLRPTAVKILFWSLPDTQGHNPEAWFIAEARNVARVNHPHVVQIYSVARHGTYCYIAMEYVDGATADAWIARKGPYPVEQATELLIQVAGALQAAHDANVIHRDVKPENLLVSNEGIAKLGDFGMAMHTTIRRVTDATRAGTPHYTAPEIWRGEIASVSTDIYALGATYYYLLTGHPPFAAKELQELIAAHLNADVPELRRQNGNFPLACQELLQRCMAKHPSQRYPSAQALGWEARALLRRMSSVPPPSGSAAGVSLKNHLERLAPGKPPAAPVPDPVSPLIAAPKGWRSFYGLTRQPFTTPEPGELPCVGAPFASLIEKLEAELFSGSCIAVQLEGSKGSGRTTLAQLLVNRRAPIGACAHISCDGLGPTVTLAKKALRALGTSSGIPQGVAQDLDAFIECCLATRGTSAIPLLVIDDCRTRDECRNEIASLTLAARLTNSFRLLLISDPDFELQIPPQRTLSRDVDVKKVTVPALDASNVSDYIESWLRCTLSPNAPALLFTPDAIQLVTYRSQGVLAKINRIVTNMLIAGAAQERRVLDSWDAWSAPLESSSLVERVRPKDWPTQEVLEVINNGRRATGMEPRLQ